MKKILNFIKQSFIGRTVRYLVNNPFLVVVIILLAVVGKDKCVEWYDEYMILYHEANNKIEEEKSKQGLTFTKIDNSLYTLMGTVEEGDCEKISPQMPQAFTLILESPGGNLAEGSCLAAHIKSVSYTHLTLPTTPYV